MVKYLILIFILLFSVDCFSQQPAFFKRGTNVITNPECCEAAPEYIYLEDFEDTVSGVTLEGWVNPGLPPLGVMDFSYEEAPIQGSKSLRLKDGAKPYLLACYESSPEIWAYFQMKRLNKLDGGPVFLLADGSPFDKVGIYWLNNGIVRIYEGTGPTFVYAETSNAFLGTGIVHFWLRYTAGTGANSIAEVYVSTSETKPLAGSGDHAIITTGQSMDEVTSVWLYSQYTNDDFVFDKIRISRTKIGSFPL